MLIYSISRPYQSAQNDRIHMHFNSCPTRATGSFIFDEEEERILSLVRFFSFFFLQCNDDRIIIKVEGVGEKKKGFLSLLHPLPPMIPLIIRTQNYACVKKSRIPLFRCIFYASHFECVRTPGERSTHATLVRMHHDIMCARSFHVLSCPTMDNANFCHYTRSSHERDLVYKERISKE